MAEHKPINYNNIPSELIAINQWVCWIGEHRDGKFNKYPVNPETGRNASHSSASTWTNFTKAKAFYEQQKPVEVTVNRGKKTERKVTGIADGIGFVFSEDDPYVGIDLDNCRNLETGEIATWARELIQLANTYSEVSPSGKGVKLWIKGRMPGNKGKRNDHYQTGGIEMYPHYRFFTVTGQHLDETPLEIVENQAAIEYVVVDSRFGNAQFLHLYMKWLLS